MVNYVPLHVHDEYSIFDGTATIEELAKRAVEVGFSAVAQTNHGTLSGHREFYRTMKAHGIKPILGLEAYYCPDIYDKRDNKDRTDPLDQNYTHLIILAKNDNGLENLSRLSEIGWGDGFYKKPRIDWEVLNKYGDDLIITSGCMGGFVNQAIENERYADAKEHLLKFKKRFGDDYYVEVMPHNVEGMNDQLLELADTLDIKPVVTPDSHHATKEQREMQEIVLLLQTHAKVLKDSTYQGSTKFENILDRLDYLYGDDRQMSFKDFQIHLLSGDEMFEAMASEGITRTDIYENSLEIADKVEEYNVREGLDLLPAQYRNPDERLYSLVKSAMKDKGLAGVPEYEERVELEMRHISVMDQSKYLILVSNMVNWTKKQGILVGVGRGSGAGCLIGYLLGITGIDPIKHNLLFARFLDAGSAQYEPMLESM